MGGRPWLGYLRELPDHPGKGGAVPADGRLSWLPKAGAGRESQERRWEPRLELGAPGVSSRTLGGRVLTGDLHHAVLGLDRELLGGEVVDVQGHAPAIGRVPELRDAAAELPAERAAVSRGGHGHGGGPVHRRPGQRAHVARPAAGAEPLRKLLGQPRHPEGRVEEAAVRRVPVSEGVPAEAPLEREGHAALGHAGVLWGASAGDRRSAGALHPAVLLWASEPGIFSRRVSGLY